MNVVIDKFDGISLSQMDGVKLMNRTDRKYWFNISHLAMLLEKIKEDYYLLEIEGERDMLYSTIYYDTCNDEMYNNHHRGKLNRYKIRQRSYLSTESSFLEVKFKSNKGRTIKERKVSIFGKMGFGENDDAFIQDSSPYSCHQLRAVLENSFRRLMLVSKNMDERCTIDTQLQFANGPTKAKLDDLAIVEVKSDGHSHSAIIDAMHQMRLKPSGFSKYCMGRSIIDSNLKKNLFKEKHREIERRIGTPLDSLLERN